MELISLSVLDLSLAACLVVLLAILSWHLQLGLQKTLIIAASRSVIQLTLLGLVLKQLFQQSSLPLIGLISLIMLTVAGYEVMARQGKKFSGWWGMGIGTSSMFLSSFSITLLALFT
ncbi:MAG: ABC transporter permease, partial [Gammaproteobacteria bacterium]|nr:ABC transporter permease [Gammaproteobacteria bacterium]